MKPYINLNQEYPGIVSLFMFDKGIAKHLSNMAEEVMRRPGTLSVADRELIASYVSQQNNCQFCYQSHTACAKEVGNATLVHEVIEESKYDRLSPKMAALLDIAGAVAKLNRPYLPSVIEYAKTLGATDQEIHDTVFISAFFCMCNRYVDGLGTTFAPGEPEEGGRSLAKYGYLMGIRRFVSEILPKMWSEFWGQMDEFYVQRKFGDVWVNEPMVYFSLSEARRAAKAIPIGHDPEPLRIVDMNGNVCGWAYRNGWSPIG